MVILLRYGEIHLKGLNRPYFEQKLKNNIKNVLRDFEDIKLKRVDGRFVLHNLKDEDIELISQRLTYVFGLHSFSVATVCDKDFETVQKTALELLHSKIKEGDTFKVTSKRADKKYIYNSMEINRELGGYLLTNTDGISVDVHNPTVTLSCEIRDQAYLYVDRVKCLGGMPVGCNGKAGLLLSGGIDSPVAGFMTMKRGVSIECIHFYSFPYTGELAKQKVIDLCKKLYLFGGSIKLHVVPFTHIQKEIYEKCPNNQLTVIMRRYMMKIADRIAINNGCSALVTGEAIGQVASQTLASLSCTDSVSTLPVIRPLICFDKEEIIKVAKDIDTFETSILPYEDCCTVFTPDRPVTNPKIKMIEKSEQVLEEENLIGEAINDTEEIIITLG